VIAALVERLEAEQIVGIELAVIAVSLEALRWRLFGLVSE